MVVNTQYTFCPILFLFDRLGTFVALVHSCAKLLWSSTLAVAKCRPKLGPRYFYDALVRIMLFEHPIVFTDCVLRAYGFLAPKTRKKYLTTKPNFLSKSYIVKHHINIRADENLRTKCSRAKNRQKMYKNVYSYNHLKDGLPSI